jgi:multiple sugar transport system substrate-binding protein
MRLKRGVMLATVFVMGSGLVAGCGTSNTNNSSGSTSNNASANSTSSNSTSSNSTASSSSGTTTITWEAGYITHKGMRAALIKAFEQQNPNIKVNLINEPANSTAAVITTTISSGSKTPDVYLGDVIWPAQFGHAGLAQPLNSMFSQSFWSRFAPGLVKGATYQGKIYGAPFFVDTAFLYYRKDLLQKAGISSPPTTWQQLQQDSQLMQKKGLVKYGFVWQGAPYEGLTCNFEEYLADAGGNVLGSNGQPTVNTPQVKQALTFMQSLVQSGVTPKSVTTDQESQSMNVFANGDAAFLRNWSYAWGVANDPTQSKVAGKVGVTILPAFPGQNQHYSTIGGWNMMVNPHSTHMNADQKFIDFVTSQAGQDIIASYGEIPTNSAAATKASQATNASPIFQLLTKLNYRSRPSQTPQYLALSKVIYTNVNGVLAGNESVSSAISQMQSQLKSTIGGGGL